MRGRHLRTSTNHSEENSEEGFRKHFINQSAIKEANKKLIIDSEKLKTLKTVSAYTESTDI
jgi:hypothetical protein